jgi:hypothetical protein
MCLMCKREINRAYNGRMLWENVHETVILKPQEGITDWSRAETEFLLEGRPIQHCARSQSERDDHFPQPLENLRRGLATPLKAI